MTPDAAETLEFRSDVMAAADVVPPYWPITTFIAVNPLGGSEASDFGEALRLAGERFGARGTLTEQHFRRLFDSGRIGSADLRRAIARECPRALALDGVTLGGRRFEAADIIECDLRYGPCEPLPTRSLCTRSELIEPRVDRAVNDQTAKWCAAFFGAEDAAWPMPGRARGLYPVWRDLAWRDRALPSVTRRAVRRLPPAADAAAVTALEMLGVDHDERLDYLRAHLSRMPGWAGYIRWRADSHGDTSLTDYLAVRLSYEALLLAGRGGEERGAAPCGQPTVASRVAAVAEHVAPAVAIDDAERGALAQVLERVPVGRRRLIWQHAYESGYRTALLGELPTTVPVAPPRPPQAQVVFCIDTRSEELRRHLEAAGPYETLGFAGFFAVAVRYREFGSAVSSEQCPVLVTPRNAVTERPLDENAATTRRSITGRRTIAAAEDAFYTAKYGTVSPFALAEFAGWAAGPVAAAKTLAPSWHNRLRRTFGRRLSPVPATTVAVDEGFTADEKNLIAEAALTMMGLTKDFAPLIVLCGHGSSTENNPFASALHCGACGGHRGAVNARTAAAILNGPDVRGHLASRGIVIPSDTWFVPAEHDTARDTVTLYDEDLVPAHHRPAVQRLQAALAEAGAQASLRRVDGLPGAPRRPTARKARRHTLRRSTDWAQVYPEWGLVGNASFIVGPRALTAGVDLGRRAFLHSYDAATDPSGVGLETILTAPLIVAQWINHQYYFSTVDPDVFGAGTKTIHNVVGGVGVQSGQTGDLRLGLPWQSVAVGEELMHEPLRLLAVVQAPLDRIDAIIERNRALADLIDGEWIAMTARETYTDPWQLRTRTGWQPNPYRKRSHDESLL